MPVARCVVADVVFDELQTPIGGVPSHKVVQVWDRVEPLLKRVVKPETGWSLQAVLTALQMGTFQLWVIGDFQAVVITQVQDRPEQRVFWVQFIVGDGMQDWLDDWIAVQEAFAREHKCAAVEFSGRKGWRKISEKQYEAYKPVLTIFRREL